MPAESDELARIQRWMHSVITHPNGVAGGVESSEGRREFDIGTDDLERVITRSRALTAADRIEIYANAYYARLLECLRGEFAILAKTLGEELFDEFAFGYLQDYPSKNYTLNKLGENFPRYLAESCPADEDPDWAAFLIDLATLERVYSEVFDGPGVEGQPLLSAGQLLAIAPDQWPDARLEFAAGFRLVELRSPVHLYISAMRHDEEATPPVPAETWLAVHRRDYVVRRVPLSRPQFVLLRALSAGETVGESIGQMVDAGGIEMDELAAELRAWFRDWAAEGFFRAAGA